MSDESYRVDAKEYQSKQGPARHKRPAHETHSKRTFDYKCGGHNEPVGEMCCYKIKPIIDESHHPSPNSLNNDVVDGEQNDDSHVHTSIQHEKFCHRMPNEQPKSAARSRKPKGTLVIILFVFGYLIVSK